MVPLFLLPFSVFPVLCSNRSSNLTHFHPSGIPNGFSSSVMGASVFERALFVRLRSLSIFSSKNSREFSGVLGALPLGEGVADKQRSGADCLGARGRRPLYPAVRILKTVCQG